VRKGKELSPPRPSYEKLGRSLIVMANKAINLKGIPEPIARGLEVVAEMARQLAGTKAKPQRRKRIRFASRKGKVLTPLTREEIYADGDE
jgi:hypothetical protein